VGERSDLNGEILCDRIILALVPLFQAILSKFWRKRSAVCENSSTWFTFATSVSGRRGPLSTRSRPPGECYSPASGQFLRGQGERLLEGHAHDLAINLDGP
jgi:hypothetical protein